MRGLPRLGTWTIHRRIVVMTAVTLGLALALGVAAFALSLDRILYAASQDAARGKASQVAESIRTRRSTPTEAVEATVSRGAIIQVLDPSGAVVTSSEVSLRDRPIARPASPRGTVDQFQSASLPGEVGEPHAVVTEAVSDSAGTAYTVAVAVPLEVESDTVKTATVLLSVGSLLMWILIVVMVSRGVRRALAPVESIRADVDRITQVRGVGRVTQPRTDDEIARLARTMNHMLDRLARADAATRRFVSDASHELRSPIATIRASMEIDPGRAPGAREDRDAVVLAETLRMQRLVDDLLTLAKADDRAPLVRADADLDELVVAEVRRLRTTGAVEVRAEIEPVRVTGDVARLAQLVRNLVDNACRYARSTVALSVVGDGAEGVVRVDNDGPPIPPEHRRAVFDRFTRLDESRARDAGGSGLGLAIVASIAEAHGGRVTALETDDGWCRFEVRLPRQQPPRPPAEPAPPG